MNHHIMTKEFEKAHDAIDRMDKKLGGDPYINFFRGFIRCSQNRYPEGRTLLKKTMAQCPELQEPYFSLLEHSVNEKGFPTTTWVLEQLRDTLGLVYEDLKAQPLFAEYVKSPEYKKWIGMNKKKVCFPLLRGFLLKSMAL